MEGQWAVGDKYVRIPGRPVPKSRRLAGSRLAHYLPDQAKSLARRIWNLGLGAAVRLVPNQPFHAERMCQTRHAIGCHVEHGRSPAPQNRDGQATTGGQGENSWATPTLTFRAARSVIWWRLRSRTGALWHMRWLENCRSQSWRLEFQIGCA